MCVCLCMCVYVCTSSIDSVGDSTYCECEYHSVCTCDLFSSHFPGFECFVRWHSSNINWFNSCCWNDSYISTVGCLYFSPSLSQSCIFHFTLSVLLFFYLPLFFITLSGYINLFPSTFCLSLSIPVFILDHFITSCQTWALAQGVYKMLHFKTFKKKGMFFFHWKISHRDIHLLRTNQDLCRDLWFTNQWVYMSVLYIPVCDIYQWTDIRNW